MKAKKERKTEAINLLSYSGITFSSVLIQVENLYIFEWEVYCAFRIPGKVVNL